MVGNAISMLLWIFADSFEVFLLSRIVGGLTEGNVQMSVAMISDITDVGSRSKALVI
jgi:predicted MFS family arabinose efflux permease